MTATQAQRMIGTGPKALREKDDFYSTPVEVTRALLAVETFEGAIWEPACGQGHISKELVAAGHEVLSTDLVDRGFGQGGIDFLMEWKPKCPNIVTNPPFKLAEAFAHQALILAEQKVCIFQRIHFLETQKRAAFFRKSHLSRVWVFAKRVSTARNGDASIKGGMIPFAWFVWDRAHEGKPVLGWL